MSEVKVAGRNGYEIRADILELAQKHVMDEYNAAIENIRLDYGVDGETGQTSSGAVLPKIPTVDDVIATANKFYEFVNQSKK